MKEHPVIPVVLRYFLSRKRFLNLGFQMAYSSHSVISQTTKATATDAYTGELLKNTEFPMSLDHYFTANVLEAGFHLVLFRIPIGPVFEPYLGVSASIAMVLFKSDNIWTWNSSYGEWTPGVDEMYISFPLRGHAGIRWNLGSTISILTEANYYWMQFPLIAEFQLSKIMTLSGFQFLLE
jgi:hypothetical protein